MEMQELPVFSSLTDCCNRHNIDYFRLVYQTDYCGPSSVWDYLFRQYLPKMEAFQSDLYYDCLAFHRLIGDGNFPRTNTTKECESKIGSKFELVKLKPFCIVIRQSGTYTCSDISELRMTCQSQKKNIGKSFVCGVVFQIIPEIPYKDADHYVFRLHVYETIWENL